MPGQSGPLRYPIFLLGLAAVLVSTGQACGHALLADYQVLPERKIRIESWFDLGGNAPRNARVQVFRADGQLLTEGQLDDQGSFIFSFPDAQPLHVAVSAPGGHRAELDIPATKLGAAPAGSASVASPVSTPPIDHEPRVGIKDGLVGIGFLLAVAAFVLSLRNARQLKQLAGGTNRRGNQVVPGASEKEP